VALLQRFMEQQQFLWKISAAQWKRIEKASENFSARTLEQTVTVNLAAIRKSFVEPLFWRRTNLVWVCSKQDDGAMGWKRFNELSSAEQQTLPFLFNADHILQSLDSRVADKVPLDARREITDFEVRLR